MRLSLNYFSDSLSTDFSSSPGEELLRAVLHHH